MRDPDLLNSVQIMMQELGSPRQSRLRAREALHKIRATLSDLTGIAIAPPSRKTFDAEGKLTAEERYRGISSGCETDRAGFP